MGMLHLLSSLKWRNKPNSIYYYYYYYYYYYFYYYYYYYQVLPCLQNFLTHSNQQVHIAAATVLLK